MKDLFDSVNEGILDDVDDILDKADKSAYKSALKTRDVLKEGILKKTKDIDLKLKEFGA